MFEKLPFPLLHDYIHILPYCFVIVFIYSLFFIPLGKQWKLLSDAERRPYVVRSEKLREEHMRRYPDYKYRPKKKAKEEKEKEKAAQLQANQTQVHINTNTATNVIDNNNLCNNKNIENGIIKLGPATTVAYNTARQLLKPIKQKANTNLNYYNNCNATLQKLEGAKLVNIKSGQCLMPSGKPFLTLSRQVGKIGSLSLEDGNFSISPQKIVSLKTTSVASGQKMFRANPLTPPPNVPESLVSPLDLESHCSFYDDIVELDAKKPRSDSSSSAEFQTAPTWTQSDAGSDSGVDIPVSPLSDISTMVDFPDIYTTPEVSELLSAQWLDSSLGF